jgi:hypothetical protein
MMGEKVVRTKKVMVWGGMNERTRRIGSSTENEAQHSNIVIVIVIKKPCVA